MVSFRDDHVTRTAYIQKYDSSRSDCVNSTLFVTNAWCGGGEQNSSDLIVVLMAIAPLELYALHEIFSRTCQFVLNLWSLFLNT